MKRERPPQKLAEEVEALLEAKYHYDREGCPSTVAYVATHTADLVDEFAGWAQATKRSMDPEGLREWERGRFGQELHPAAHGILLDAVFVVTGKKRGRRIDGPFYSDAARRRYTDAVRARPRAPHEKPLDYIRTIAANAAQEESDGSDHRGTEADPGADAREAAPSRADTGGHTGPDPGPAPARGGEARASGIAAGTLPGAGGHVRAPDHRRGADRGEPDRSAHSGRRDSVREGPPGHRAGGGGAVRPDSLTHVSDIDPDVLW